MRWYPELALLPDADAQARAWKCLGERHVAPPYRRVVRLGFGALAFLGLLLAFSGRPVFGAVVLAIGVLGFPSISIFLNRRHVRHELREYLNRHGTPVCMGCGYCLTGAAEWYCPECGRVIEHFADESSAA